MSAEVYTESRQERIRSRRHKRKQGRLARLRRQIIRYSVLAALFYVGCAGFVKVPWSAMDPGQDVKITGNQVATSAQISQVLMPYMRKPVYALDPHQLAERIQQLPCIHKAFVRRHLLPRPHLVVHIMEEFPWAGYSKGPEEPVEAVISQTGRIIPVSAFPAVPQPQLKIYGGPGFKLTQQDVIAWANWIQYTTTQTGRTISFVDLRNPGDIQMQADELALHVGGADTTLSKRLSRLSSIMPAIEQLKEPIEYIDLGLDANVPVKVAKIKPGRQNLRTPQRTVTPAQTLPEQASPPTADSSVPAPAAEIQKPDSQVAATANPL